MTTTYPSLSAFYDARYERHPSREYDYGVWWTDKGQRWPVYRVSYVRATGEVYAVSSRTGTVEILGVAPAGSEHSRWDCDGLLSGWADLGHDEQTLGWVRQRLGTVPLGRTVFGFTCWRLPLRPGCHLAWGGPGDRVHLRTGGRFDPAGDQVGEDDGHVDWRQCDTLAEAQEVVTTWLALEAQTSD